VTAIAALAQRFGPNGLERTPQNHS
jgi:hypothetical protein